MKFIKRLLRVLRILLFAFMFAVCMVLGVVPVIPKRKEESAEEEAMLEQEQGSTSETVLFEAQKK